MNVVDLENDPRHIKHMEERKKKIEDALSQLKGTGFPLDMTSSTGRYTIVSDNIELECINGETKVVLEGIDITRFISGANVSINPNRFPVVTVVFNPAININSLPSRYVNIHTRKKKDS